MRETTVVDTDDTFSIFPSLLNIPLDDSTDRRPVVLVGIRGARGTSGTTDYARLLSYGRTTTSDISGTRSGVVKIDRVLEPWIPDWWHAWGWAAAMGAMGVLGIVAFWTGVVCLFRRGENEATYEPLDTGDAEEEG